MDTRLRGYDKGGCCYDKRGADMTKGFKGMTRGAILFIFHHRRPYGLPTRLLAVTQSHQPKPAECSQVLYNFSSLTSE